MYMYIYVIKAKQKKRGKEGGDQEAERMFRTPTYIHLGQWTKQGGGGGLQVDQRLEDVCEGKSPMIIKKKKKGKDPNEKPKIISSPKQKQKKIPNRIEMYWKRGG